MPFAVVLVIAFLAGLFVAGVVLVFRGDRYALRRGVCTCGYITTHAPGDSARCPECGSSIQVGRRRRSIRGGRVRFLGIVLILASILGPPAVLTAIYLLVFIYAAFHGWP